MRVFGLLFLCFATTGSPLAEGITGDGELSTEIAEANNLAIAFLDVMNSREGIEYLGGPFAPRNYIASAETEGKMAHITYSYKFSGVPQGDPNSFVISSSPVSSFAYSKPDSSIRLSMSILPADCSVLGDMTSADLEAIMNMIPYDYSPSPYEKDSGCIVQIDSKGAITRKARARTNLHSIHAINSDRVQILFTHSYQSGMTGVLGELRDLELYREVREDGTYRFRCNWPLAVTLLKKPRHSPPYEFILFGHPDDKELSQMVAVIQRVPRISGISIISDGVGLIEVVTSSLSSNLRFGSIFYGTPLHSVTLEKSSSGWQVVRKASIESIQPNRVYDRARPILPLYEKPHPEGLAHVVSQVEWVDSGGVPVQSPTHWSQKDVEKICEIVMRLRGLDDWNARYLVSEEVDSVTVWTGTSHYRSERIEFIRAGDKLLITAVGAGYP